MKLKTSAITLLAAFLLLGLPMSLEAKPENTDKAKQMEVKRQKRMEKMKSQRLKGLQERVGLSKEKADKIAKIMEGNETKRRDMNTKKREGIESLQGMLKADKPDSGQVSKKVTEIKTIEQEMEKLKDQELAAVNKELTQIEQAKYYLMKTQSRGRSSQRSRKPSRGNRAGR